MTVTIQPGQRAAYNFLKKHKVGTLATVSPGGEPHAAAIFYTVDSALTISFVTKTGTKKAHNLEHDPRAMLLVYEAETQTTVQISGRVTKVIDDTKTNELLSEIVYASVEVSHTDVAPIFTLDEGGYVMYQLTPTQVHMATFSHKKPGDYHTLFKTIILNENEH